MDSGEPRYGYSRLSDYTISLEQFTIKDDLIIGKGIWDTSAGGGNDTIIPIRVLRFHRWGIRKRCLI